MKVSLAAVVLACGALWAQDVVLHYDFDSGQISIVDGPYGQSIVIPGAAPLAHPGDPALPAMSLCAVLPSGTAADYVTVDDISEAAFPGTVDIRPMQHAVPISRPGEFAPTPRNSGGYSGEADLPVIQLSGQGSLMGFPVADLLFRPVSWDPVSGRMTVRTSVDFTIHCSPAAGNAPAARSAQSEELARSVVQARVINPRDVGASGASIVSALDLPYGEYLIITPQSLSSAFEPLAAFKTTIGVPASIVTTEFIDMNYSGVDQAQRIRFFLRDLWDDGAPTWILLGGDVAQVDARNCWATAEGYVDNPAADIYYMDMNDTAPGADSWDHDNDGVWGEIGQDLMDYHPDYFAGRAPCENAAEVGIFISKVMDYSIPSVDTRDTDPWYTSMGFTTGVLWYSPFCPGSAGKEKIDTLYTPPAWLPIIKHYEEAGTQSYEATMEMLNAGMHLVNHAGHGSETLVSIGTGYLQNSDFMGLTNISAHGRVSIWDTIACLSGAFDTSECLAEAWVTSPNGGGFCMMNTRYGWGEPSDPGDQWSDLVDQQFFAGFFVDDFFHLGTAAAMAWDEYIGLIPSDTHYDWIAKSITLFGDPELPMWSAEPAGVLQVGCPNPIQSGPSTLTVTLTDDNGPIEGGRICVLQGAWNDPICYVVGTTSAAGQAILNIDLAASPSTVKVSGWARNHAPVTLDIPVVAQGIGEGTEPLVTLLGNPVPSPASSSVSIPWSVSSGSGTMTVYDLQGRRIASPGTGLHGSGTLEWDLTGYDGNTIPAGIYMVRLDAPDASLTRRVVIVR
jgi:hypothetical protein